jgi:hypothetical protein
MKCVSTILFPSRATLCDGDDRDLSLVILTLSPAFNACPVDVVVFACPELTENGWRSLSTVPFNRIVIHPPFKATADDEEADELASAISAACNNSLSVRFVTRTNVGGLNVPDVQTYDLFVVHLCTLMTDSDENGHMCRLAMFPELAFVLETAPFNLRELSLNGVWAPPDGPSVATASQIFEHHSNLRILHLSGNDLTVSTCSDHPPLSPPPLSPISLPST